MGVNHLNKKIQFKEHHPPHIYINNSLYFVTARTIDKIHYFNTKIKKNILKKVIIKAQQKFKILICAWVILDNHYHILFKILNREDLPQFIRNINVNSSRLLNKLENKIGRNIWYQYLDRCIRNKKDFYQHFNYIHHNPVKHRYMRNQDEVTNYDFCSYKNWLKGKGKEWMIDVFKNYPIKDFNIEESE